MFMQPRVHTRARTIRLYACTRARTRVKGERSSLQIRPTLMPSSNSQPARSNSSAGAKTDYEIEFLVADADESERIVVSTTTPEVRYLRHNYSGHNYLGHDYLGHNYSGYKLLRP